MRYLRYLAVMVLLVTASVARAGETGSISGKVLDAAGAPLPGVIVRVSGPQLPAGRTTSSSTSGAYNFPRLLPGTYTVTAELQGLGKTSRSVDVRVDNDYQIDLSLVAGREAAVEVVAASVDAKSTEVSTNFASSEIRQLPIARSYEGLLSLIPSAPATSGNGYVSVAGGTRQDNKYLVDGVNITNPGYGYLGVDTNELDIADVNVKTGAISAEFGRTSGAIVNAVTKSGTNDVHGSFRFEARPSSLANDRKTGITQDVDTYNGAANVGFPILKDTLFGFVSGRYSATTTSGQSATISGVTTTQPDTKSKAYDYFAKLTAYAGQNLLVNAGFRGLPNNSDNYFNSIYDAESAAYDADTSNFVGNLTVDWFLSKDIYLEGKYVHLTQEDTYGARNVLTNRPLTIDPLNLWKYGAYADPARNRGNSGVYAFAEGGEAYKRDEVKLTASQYLDIGPTHHQITRGGGAEFIDNEFNRTSNGWGTLIYTTTTVGGVSGTPVVRARYYNNQPLQTGKARTYSAFLQDTLTWNRLSATLGVLVNYDDFAQVALDGTRYNFMTFNWKDQVQPRLGVVYNADLLKGDKFYTNYGEYAGLDQKSTVRSFAPFRIREDQSYFLRSTGDWIREEIRGSSAGKLIPEDLKAPYIQELVAGYSAPVTRDISFDLYYQYRNLKDPFEDTPVNPDSYFLSFQAKTYPDARRVYRGVTFDVTKRYANSWYANLSYTYSKLYGNWDEDQAVGSFNTSSYLEDEPGVNSAEPNRWGRFTQDRPHIFKVLASYDIYGVTVGGFLRVQSGRAWEARGYTASGTTLRYLEPAGSRRLPTWTNFDLLAAYTLQLGGDLSVRLEGRCQNLFNSQTVLSVDQLQYLDSYRDGTPPRELGPQGTTQPNPNFGAADSWAAPRRFILTALFNF